jgi:hypothetical protein
MSFCCIYFVQLPHTCTQLTSMCQSAIHPVSVFYLFVIYLPSIYNLPSCIFRLYLSFTFLSIRHKLAIILPLIYIYEFSPFIYKSFAPTIRLSVIHLLFICLTSDVYILNIPSISFQLPSSCICHLLLV